jgi:hypothetical protein
MGASESSTAAVTGSSSTGRSVRQPLGHRRGGKGTWEACQAHGHQQEGREAREAVRSRRPRFGGAAATGCGGAVSASGAWGKQMAR